MRALVCINSMNFLIVNLYAVGMAHGAKIYFNCSLWNLW